MSSLSSVIDKADAQKELSKMLHTGNNTPPVGLFNTVQVYKNNNQIRVATDILNFLHAVSTRDEDIILEEDAARGALIAGVKFTIQDYYRANKRQFTKEHKQKILKDIEAVIDTQLSSIHIQQVLAH